MAHEFTFSNNHVAVADSNLSQFLVVYMYTV